MADRKVEVDILASDKTAAGIDSASKRMKKFGDDAEREGKKAGDRAGSGVGSRIGSSLSKSAAKIGESFAKLGVSAGAKLGDSISGALSNASPQIQGAVGGAVLAAVSTLAPLIGATLAGAVIGSAAGVGIIGGVVLAARDSRVQSAAQSLGQRIMSSLNEQGGVFLEPVLRSITMIQERFDKLSPTIGRGLQAAARYVVPLTDALLDAGEAITTGIVAAIENAGPVVGSLSQGIRTVGDAVGYAIGLFAKLGPQAATAFNVVFEVVGFAIIFIADLIYALAKVWGWITTLGGLVGDDGAGMKELGTDAQATSDALGGVNVALDDSTSSATSAASAYTALGNAQKSVAETAVALDQAEINFRNTLDQVNKTREKGAKVTDNERQQLINLKGAIDQQVTALQESGATSADVNAKANELRESFVKQATQMGMNRQKAEELANQYGLFPRHVDTDMRLTGAEKARRELERVRAKAGSIPDQINIAIRVTGSAASRQAIQAALAKQSLMADAVGAFGDAAAQFAERRAFAPLAGAGRVPGGSQRVNLTNRVTVQLDGRTLAPEMARTATAVFDERDWRERSGKR